MIAMSFPGLVHDDGPVSQKRRLCLWRQAEFVPASEHIASEGEASSARRAPPRDPNRVRSLMRRLRQSQPSYICGYCGTVKTSQAAGSDGKGVRIRCGCGGKHRDNQPRMHANWKRIAGDGGKTLMARLVPRAVTSPMLQSLQPGPV